MTVFDDVLQKRFDEAPLISAIEVTSNDTLLIRDLETGQVMRIPVSIFYSALGSAFASLVDGKVPASQLPSYVDDVLEYANLAAFPGTGESGKIYIALDTNKTYRWSGSAYVEISASLALGETSSTAYRGDRGKTAYDHSQTIGNPHGTTKADLDLGNVDNTSDAKKPVSTAQATAIALKANKSQESIQNPSFLNGWANFSSSWQQAGYFKDEFGIVHLQGLVKDGTPSAAIFQLPSGYRPSLGCFFSTVAGGSFAVCTVSATGEVNHSGGATNFFSLDGITFKAA